MKRVLYALIWISGLIDALAGIAILMRLGHPLLRELFPGVLGHLLAESAGVGGHHPITFLSGFVGLALIFAAALHALAWRWLQDEKDEAHHLLNLYGGFVLLAGVLLYFAAQGPRWIFLAFDAARGALLLVFSWIVLVSPSTLSALHLPGEHAQRPYPRRQPREPGDRQERGRRRRPFRGRAERSGRGSERKADGGDGDTRRVSRRPEQEERPAPAQTGEGAESRERPRRPRRRRRRTPTAEASAPVEGIAETSAPTPESKTWESTGAEPNEGRRERPRGRGGRSRSRQRSPRRTAADDKGGTPSPDPAPEPKPTRPAPDPTTLPWGPVGDPASSPDDRRTPPVESSRTVAGRRAKRGRYSTGALFRPRLKRVHRPLGGDPAHAEKPRWSWPEDPGEPGPSRGKQRLPEGEESERADREETNGG